MSGKVYFNGKEIGVVSKVEWSAAAPAWVDATVFGPGSKTYRIPAVPQFRFGDVIRYRSIGREVYVVLTTDPENGDLMDLLALDNGCVYHDRKDPAMWEVVE